MRWEGHTGLSVAGRAAGGRRGQKCIAWGGTHALLQTAEVLGRGSPLWLRMWISRELALGQLLRHWGKGQTRSLG